VALIILWAETVYRLLLLPQFNHCSCYSLISYEYFHSVKKNQTNKQGKKQDSAPIFLPFYKFSVSLVFTCLLSLLIHKV